jgi:predicted GNAT family acetyltransferase
MFGGSNFGINGPFTPPYYHGGAYVIFEFNPTESKKYTLEEIQSQVTISYHRFPNWNLTGALGADGPMGGPGTFGTASFQVENRAETNSMQISASVNLLGRVSAKDLFKFQNVDLTGGDRWVIQTKFETPILNFIDVSSSAGLTPIGSNTTGSAAVSGGINTRPFGMWHQYGRLPQGEEGVFLEISKPKFRPLIVESSDSDGNFTNPVGSAPRSDLSLASLIGFNATSQKLGQVAETKTIREAVVAVPFVEEDNKRKFFEISRAALIAQSSTEGGTVFSTNVDSIQQMMDSMERYVMPPSFDFLTYPDDATPVTMYIFEFEHALNQQDLTNIWQNLPPRIARAFDPDNGLETSQIKQTKEITHSLGDRELLADVEDKLQWMVFKVKQRAKTNYFEKVIESNSKTDIPESLQGQGLGQTLSKKNAKETDFLGGGAAKGANTLESEDTIGYNWPYDFFSLVELAKIDEDVVFGTPVAVTVDQDFDASTITQGDGGFTMPTKKVSKTVVEQIADQATGGFTQDNVQNSFKTETTKTVATQVDPSNNNQLVRTGVVAKEESSSTNPVDSTAFPTTPTKSVSKEVNKDSTIVMTKEETTTEMTSDDSKQVSDSVDKNFKL